jgi:hypothetical protein
VTFRAPLFLLALTALLALLPPGGVAVCPVDGTISLGGLAGCPCERGEDAPDEDHGVCDDLRSPGLVSQAPSPLPAVDGADQVAALGAPAALPHGAPAGPRPAVRPDRGPPPRPPAALAALATVRLRI